MTAASKNPTSKLSPEFGPWLRRARMGMRLNLTEFAARARLSPDTIRSFELNRKLEGSYSVEVFNRLAKGLDMELGYVLHKVGFDIGRDGLDLSLMRKVEEAAEAFGTHESQLRAALAEAMGRIDSPSLNGRDELIVELGRSLAVLDRVTERLRRAGFGGRRVAEDEVPATLTRRFWTEDEIEFLRANPDLSHEEVGKHLGRSADAVRNYRQYQLSEGVSA